MRFEARVPNWATRKFLTTNLERTAEGKWFWQINLPVLTAALPVLESNPLRDDDRFGGPVLFIAGGKSNYIEPGDHATMREHFPAARIQMVADAGHNPHMETRSEFVRAVLGGG
jgi:pimeloyl-ACP methyl ester carboxylesterase